MYLLIHVPLGHSTLPCVGALARVSHLLLCEGSFWGTLRLFISFSMELEEADCRELGCLKQPGYFLSSECSLLTRTHKDNIHLMDVGRDWARQRRALCYMYWACVTGCTGPVWLDVLGLCDWMYWPCVTGCTGPVWLDVLALCDWM